MDIFFKNAFVYADGTFTRRHAMFYAGTLFFPAGPVSGVPVVDGTTLCVMPGFADVHVHLREPGFSYKETIRTGTRAAARGGYTAVCPMPNVAPVPDRPATLCLEWECIRRDAVIAALPYGAITVGESGHSLSDMGGMAADVVAFSDDGRGVQSAALMELAMTEAKRLDKIIAAHCEDASLVRGGVVHDGAYAAAHGLAGICAQSEWTQVARDLAIAEKVGCAYHVCHVSTKESVSLIRAAKSRGVDVTCETAPHYVVLDESMLRDDGRFKMNPPIRTAADRDCLVQGLLDGTVDMIATDHAPHSVEEKSGGLDKSLMGVVGLETAFPVLYTALVEKGVMPLELLVELMSIKPRKRFRIRSDPGWTVFDLASQYTVDPTEFLSLGRSTPFTGISVRGRCLLTVYNGHAVWTDEAALEALS